MRAVPRAKQFPKVRRDSIHYVVTWAGSLPVRASTPCRALPSGCSAEGSLMAHLKPIHPALFAFSVRDRASSTGQNGASGLPYSRSPVLYKPRNLRVWNRPPVPCPGVSRSSVGQTISVLSRITELRAARSRSWTTDRLALPLRCNLSPYSDSAARCRTPAHTAARPSSRYSS